MHADANDMIPTIKKITKRLGRCSEKKKKKDIKKDIRLRFNKNINDK